MSDERSIRRGTTWVGLASGLSGVLDVVAMVIVMRVLTLAELGVATLAGAALPVMDRIASLGMPQALVRFGASDRRAQSTMQWLAVGGALAVLAALLGLGLPVARLLIRSKPAPDGVDAGVLASLLVGYGIKVLLQMVHLVPEATLRRELRFETLTRARMVASFADMATKLVVVYLGVSVAPGLGPWCFALGATVNVVVTSIGLQRAQPWLPALAFDRAVAARALRYGVQVSTGEVLYYTYTNADYFVIGAVWGERAVGVYRMAYELVLDVVKLISLVTAEVAFPAFSRMMATSREAGALLVRFTRQNAIALVPVVAFLGVAADDLLVALYHLAPDDLAAAATAARLLCVVGTLRVISFVLPAMLAGLGHAGDSLVYHAVGAVLLPLGFVVAATGWTAHGYVAVAWAWAIVYPFVFAVLLGRALGRAHIRLGGYLRALAGIALCGALATIAGEAVHQLAPLSPIPRLCAVALAVLAVFLLALWRIERVTPRSIFSAATTDAAPR